MERTWIRGFWVGILRFNGVFVGAVFLLILAGCRPRGNGPHKGVPAAPTVHVQAVIPAWQYPGASSSSGGTTAGLHQSSLTTTDSYQKVWEFYSKAVGLPKAYDPNANEVSSDCSSGPCRARAVSSANEDGFRSATFSYRGPDVSVVVRVSRADSEDKTGILLTIISP